MSTVVITGGSGGIGAACCRLFARRGWNVIICFNKGEHTALELERRLNADRPACARAIQADITDENCVGRLFDKAYAYFPELTALVNCAGAPLSKMLRDTSGAEWDALFDVNVKGVFLCCKRAADIMVKKGCGAIVNVSSVWGVTGASCEAAYSAAKGAVIAFTKAIAKELGSAGVRVNCVAPGAVDTAMLGCYSKADLDAFAKETPLGRIGLPEEAAACAYFLCSADSSYITGQVLSPNGGLLI